MRHPSNQSEITRLLATIESEYVASQHGLTGFAESAKHAAITARMEHIGQLHEDLRAIVGDEAMRLIAERLETVSEKQKQEKRKDEEENREEWAGGSDSACSQRTGNQ
jgi:RPA family protein